MIVSSTRSVINSWRLEHGSRPSPITRHPTSAIRVCLDIVVLQPRPVDPSRTDHPTLHRSTYVWIEVSQRTARGGCHASGGFLRCIANLLSTSRHLLEIDSHHYQIVTSFQSSSCSGFKLWFMLLSKLSRRLLQCGRDCQEYRVWILKDACRRFSQLVAECAIFNAVTERDYTTEAEKIKSCHTVSRFILLSSSIAILNDRLVFVLETALRGMAKGRP